MGAVLLAILYISFALFMNIISSNVKGGYLDMHVAFASGEGSGESAQMRRLSQTFAVRVCNSGCFPALWHV